MKKIWIWIAGAFTLILGLFFHERNKRQNAEADLQTAESDKRDAVLEEQQKQKQEAIQLQKSRLEAQKGRKLTEDEMEQFLKDL